MATKTYISSRRAWLFAGVFALAFGWAVSAMAQQPITGLQASFDSLGDDSQDYSGPGGGSSGFNAGTTYRHRFNRTAQNNLSIESFDVGTNSFLFRQLSQQINLARVNNANITGDHHVILYDIEDITDSTNINMRSSRTFTMEETLLSSFINRGADNVFANDGDGNGNNNNIERIDFIFGLPVPAFGDLTTRGFLVMDRGGNDAFQVAAITGVDSNNFPTSFSDSVRVLTSDWGSAGFDISTIVYRGYQGDLVPSAELGDQTLSGVYITWSDLNIASNTLVYGYSLVANDVSTNTSWLDVEDFPLATSPGSDLGGLDLMSGGALVSDEARNALIGDFVWNDVNQDGLQDVGETGVEGLLVEVYDQQTNLAAIAQSDSNGFYSAFGLPAGTYFMEATPPTNWLFTLEKVGLDPTVWSVIDPTTGRSDNFTLGVSETNLNFDIGIYLPPTDLAVTKSVNNTNPTVNEAISYTVVITNAGPESTDQIVVNDLLPSGLTFDSATPSQGAYTASNGVWQVGSLALGSNATLTINATVDPGTGGTSITNTASITAQFRPDTNTANNADSVELTVQSADVGVYKSVDDESPAELDNVIFTVTVTNFGPSAVTSLSVNDLLPEGLTFVSSTPSQGSYTATSGVWSVGTVLEGQAATLDITANVNAGMGGASIVNTATRNGSDQEDLNAENDTADAAITVLGADLDLTKTVNQQAPAEGDAIIYTITVNNLGPFLADDIEVIERLTNGVTFVSYNATQGTYDSTTGVWNVGAVEVSENAILAINVTVDPDTTDQIITNISSIISADVPDPNTTNNVADAVIQVRGMSVSKSSSPSSPLNLGDTISYTIVVTNFSSTPQTGVNVSDLVPTGTTYVADSAEVTVFPSIGSGGSTSLVFDTTSTFVVPSGVTNLIVEAWGAGGGGGKPNTGGGNAGGGGGGGGYARSSIAVSPGNTNTVSIGVGGIAGAAGGSSWFGNTNLVYAQGGRGGGVGSNIGVGGSANNGNQATYNGGDGGTGHTSGGNNRKVGGGGGGSAFDNANGGDGENGGSLSGGAGGDGEGDGGNGNRRLDNGEPGEFPGGGGGGGGNRSIGGVGARGRVIISYDLPGVTAGTTNAPPSLATDWTIEPGGTLTVTFDVTVDSPSALAEIVNIAATTSDRQIIPIEAGVTNALATADLAVTKSADPVNPLPGSNVVYSIIVTNNGAFNATGVELTEPLASGLSYVSDTASQGSYNSGSGIWSVGTVNAGSFATLTLTAATATNTAGQSITNIVTITGSNQADPGADNNSATSVVTVAGADIALTKTVDDPAPFAGFDVVFTITATNNGPSEANLIEIADVLPGDLAYVSSSASNGSYNDGTGIWGLGTLTVGGSATLTITATVATNAMGTVITNIASLQSSQPADPNALNDSASAVLDVRDPDELGIEKTSDVSGVIRPNDVITYTVIVTNNSAVAHTNVVVNDPIPAGTTYVPGSSELTTFQSVTNVWQDLFGSRLYSLNTGSTNFLYNWIEQGEGTSPTAGRYQVLFDTVRGETYSLRLQGGSGTRSIYRGLDLSQSTAATFSFDYRREDFSAGGVVRIQVSSNGNAGAWTTIDNIGGAGTDGAYLETNYNISAWISTNTAIRFSMDTTMGSGEIFWVDDVRIVAPVVDPQPVTVAGEIPPTMVNGATLLPGSWLSLTFEVTVNPIPVDTNIVNIATVTSERQTLPRSAEVRDSIEFSDIAVTKTVDDIVPMVGENVTFLITAINNGPFTASGIEIQDILPPGLSFAGASASEGSYNSGSGIWTIETLSVSNPVTLNLTAEALDAGAGQWVTNEATLFDLEQFDLNEENNTDEAAIRIAPVFALLHAEYNEEDQRAEIHHFFRSNIVYDLLYVDAPSFADSLSDQWGLADRGELAMLRDEGGPGRLPPHELPNGTIRFYRISAQGFWENEPRRASAEVAALNNVHIQPGQNWVRLWGNPYTNRLANSFRHMLPAGYSLVDASLVSWYDRAPFPPAPTQEVFLVHGETTKEWMQSLPAERMNEVAEDLPVGLHNGFVVEMPTNMPSTTWVMIHQLPTNSIVQTIPGGNRYSLISPFTAESFSPARLNLVEAGFTGGNVTVLSDWMWKLDRTMQTAPAVIWYRTSDQTWRFTSPGNPLVPDNYFSPNDAIVIQTRRSAQDLIWTNRPAYSAPTTRMTP